jgi:DNA invertase Pin-like site-specific DNA recombinase
VRARGCGIYVRISSDPSGQGLGVARQEKACRKKAQERGWHVAKVYADNDVSASTAKARPAYTSMLTDLEAGVIDAVVVWDLDRLTRRPIEIEHFIDVADRKGIALASVGGDVDLSTDNGRMFVRIKGAVARAEVERKSTRQKAANDQRAEAGKPFPGRRAFGYSRDGMTLNESEATEYQRIVAELLSGESLRAIVRGLKGRGVTTTAGNVWRPTELRRLLQNPRHAGLRVHRGVVVGPGQWPALIDEDTHHAVTAILSDPSRRKAGRPRRYLLTGLATCGVCGGGIYGVTEPRGPLYYCETRRHVARRAEPIDELVQDIVVGRLALPDAAEAFARADNRDRAKDLRDEERQLRRRLDGLAEAYAAGDIDLSALRSGTKRVNSRMEIVVTELTAIAATPDLAPLVTADDVGAVWDAFDVDRRRAVIEVLMDISIQPAGRGARTFDPETVTVEWKGEK